MLFNSGVFLLFFATFIALWPLLRRQRQCRWGYLIFASFFFYGWWDWRFLFLLIGSGLIDFCAALAMQRWPACRRWLLALSVLANVGTLAVFKYLDFGIHNLNGLFGWLGSEWALPLAGLTLPVGISFYTFQSMSYTIDVYRGQLRPTHHILHFFAYLAMFPQLVAGPIVRAAHLLPQLENAHPTTERQRWDGLQLVVAGYFKKMVIADNIAAAINTAFAPTQPLDNGVFWWIIAVLFAFQIYCDFSGYSDIARGLARWMGYDFPLNFNHPYIAVGFRDFWARWHISLSTWFRDYVYIPLGGSRTSPVGAHGNMWITMLVSGLWHGAAWTFVAWGAIHAAFLSFERQTNWTRHLTRLPAGRLVAMLLTFAAVLLAWILFRAESLTQAVKIIALMLNPFTFDLVTIRQHVHWRDLLLVGLLGAWHLRYFDGWPRWSLPPRLQAWTTAWQPAAVGLLIWACMFLRGPGDVFIYFQF